MRVEGVWCRVWGSGFRVSGLPWAPTQSAAASVSGGGAPPPPQAVRAAAALAAPGKVVLQKSTPHQSVNLFFISVMIMDELTDLWES